MILPESAAVVPPLIDALQAAMGEMSTSTLLAEINPGRFLGRTHPILVHFPIALLSVAGLAEAWQLLRRIPAPSPITLPLLLLGAAAAVVATIAGWFNASWEHADDTTDLLLRHRWIGTLVSAALVALAVFAWRNRHAAALASSNLAQRLATLLLAAIVGLVGHLGGEIVYGEGYLWKGLLSERGDATPSRGDGASTAPITGTPEEIFYLTSVKPIIVKRCAECHGAEKQKGRLRLDPIGMAFDGPSSGWTILAGFPDDSELVFRILLPRDDPDAMPPKGAGLSEAEVQAIETWIRNGAVVPESERTSDGPGGTARSAANTRAAPLEAKVSAALDRCLACGAIAQPIHADATLFDVNASHASPAWTDVQLAIVAEAASAIARLNLAGSGITDAGMASLPPMPALEAIRLDGTSIGDEGIAPLLQSPNLASANFVGTGLTDAGLERLLALPNLRDVFVWRSKVTDAGIAAAKASHPAVRVVGAEPPPADAPAAGTPVK